MSPAPTYSPTPVDPNETCESKIARGADLTCSACCPNECAKFEDTDVPDAYKTLNYADAYFSTYTYDFRGHDGCVCFNDMNLNSEYGSVHLTEGNDCALVISNADIHGLGGDDTLMSFTSSNFFLFGGNNNIYGGVNQEGDFFDELYQLEFATKTFRCLHRSELVSKLTAAEKRSAFAGGRLIQTARSEGAKDLDLVQELPVDELIKPPDEDFAPTMIASRPGRKRRQRIGWGWVNSRRGAAPVA